MSDVIQEIRSGNKETVKSVYQQYAKDVYNFAKSITGDHDSALEATKKTFYHLFKNIQAGEEPANLRTAALKIAYDEAYKLAAPKEEAPAPAPAPAAAPVYEEEPAYEEPAPAPQREEAPAYDEAPAPQASRYEEPEYEDEYDDGYDSYEEEDDGFVPPSRARDAQREEVYMPKGGYDTLKIDPVPVEEEQEEMRNNRRRADDAPRGKKKSSRRQAEDDYDDYDDEPVRGRSGKAGRKSNDYDDYDDYEDDYYDDDYDDEPKKPRNKGLFIFCIILNVVLILILLWFLCGLLVNLGILPNIDIGYSWFNGHIYPLF